MDNETYQTIKELKESNQKWGQIYQRYALKFKSVNAMKKSYIREWARRKKDGD